MSVERTAANGVGETVSDNIATSAGVGAVAWIATYVGTYVLTAVDGIAPSDVSTWKAVGWVFFNAHNVDVEVTGSFSSTFSYLSQPGTTGVTSTVPSIVYYILPVVVLAVAGYVAYRQVGRRLSTEAAAGVGASVAAGYLVLTVLGVFLFETTSGGSTASPKLTTGVLLAGIVYPVVAGGVGGAVGQSTE